MIIIVAINVDNLIIIYKNKKILDNIYLFKEMKILVLKNLIKYLVWIMIKINFIQFLAI